MAVLGGPPQDAALRTALREEGEDELEHPAGRKGAVREIAVIPRRDGEHAQPVQPDAQRDRRPGDAGPDRGKTAQMHEQEGDGGRVGDVTAGGTGIDRGIGSHGRHPG